MLTVFPADGVRIGKVAGERTGITAVTVDGHPGYWLDGAAHEVVYDTGDGRTAVAPGGQRAGVVGRRADLPAGVGVGPGVCALSGVAGLTPPAGDPPAQLQQPARSQPHGPAWVVIGDRPC